MAGDGAVRDVLWVEDTRDLFDVVELATTGSAFAERVVHASGVEAALATAAEMTADGRGPKLVISDLRLDDGTGWDVVTRLRETGVSPPCVIVTGSDSRGDVRHSEELDCEHVIKPVRLAAWVALTERLNRIADAGGAAP